MSDEIAQSVVNRLRDHGFVAYYAGGYVRDMLLGHPSADIDIATSATPGEVIPLFEKVIPLGEKFGSVVVVEGGETFEVTTFRKDQGYSDGRHPDEIEYSSPEEDAKRRSITINGMFYDPIEEKILDFVDGQADLKAGIVRAIGEPFKRFEEDRLRMIRAIRFATRLDFTIEPKTWEAILAHAPTLFPSVAVERVWQEFQKMGGHPNFGIFLKELDRAGLLKQIFPDDYQIEKVETFASFPEETPTIAKLWAIGADVANRLKLSKRDLRWIELLERIPKLSTPLEWVEFYREEGAQIALKVFAAGDEPFLKLRAKEEKKWQAHIDRTSPLITSQALKAEGISPGKEMGMLIREGERLAVEENLTSAEDVLKKLKKLQIWPSG